MKKMKEELKEELKGHFGDRAVFSYNEMLPYSHDVGALPGEINLLLKRMPEAIVQPITTDELKYLLDAANKYEIPLVPRGSGTSGVGGAVPVMGGIVVDFNRMDGIIEIDGKKKTVTVEPGIIWDPLEKELNKSGLSLRIYPTSSLSSTVGGWVAQGGIGIGSFQFGSIRDNIESLKLLNPLKELVEIRGSDLDVVADCEGITGFITQVTFKLRDLDETIPVLSWYDTAEDIARVIQELARSKLSLWSMGLNSPKCIEMEREAEGEGEGNLHLPLEKYVLLVAMPKSKYLKEGGKLKKILAAKGKGEIGDKKLASHKWENRFYPMRIKAIGPSLIPGEVYMPLEKLADFLKHFEKKFGKEPIALEGTLANRSEASLLAFMLHDERTFDYAFGWGFPIRFLSLAKKYKGRTYQTGIFLPLEVKNFYGKERYSRIKKFKIKNDPSNIMNPGKLITPALSSPLLLKGMMMTSGPMLKMASWALPYKRPLDGYKVNEKITAGLKKQNSDNGLHLWDVYACAQCGYCKTVCPMFKTRRVDTASPHGKLYQIKQYLTNNDAINDRTGVGFLPDEEWVEKMYCTLCSKCETICHVNIKFHEYWEEIRHWMAKKGHGPPKNAVNMYKSIFDSTYWNPFQEPREKRDEWYRDDYKLPEKADVVYFVGCMTAYHEYKLLFSYLKIFTKAGLNFTTLGPDEKCCGAINLFTGQPENFEDLARYNIGQVEKRGARTVVTGCPGCYRALNKYKKFVDYDYEMLHTSELIARLIRNGKLKLTRKFQSKKNPVIYHDPCELGRIPELELGRGVYEDPRFILNSVPGLELLEFENNKRNSDCCGGGGGLKAVDYDISTEITRQRISAGLELGATTIASMCNNCKNQMSPVAKDMKKELKNAGEKRNINIIDVAEIVARAI
ncbi:MAG: FAD-binding and (Fe-S)-binding domain-containing protein [Candidatus Thermoplasmatota archaeon]|jgi:Fe-S oxidoreductase/FAD/FMN-containing dehydrogenase|nr:FAD-binding and (Fe-S)-binding domain-containing protein [Candidatus Thermoplasmatota archaeon]